MSYDNREMTITVKREEFLASINVLKDIERKLGELKLKAEKKEDSIALMRLEGYAYEVGCYLRDLLGEEWLKDKKE